jgi:hypothetical protein
VPQVVFGAQYQSTATERNIREDQVQIHFTVKKEEEVFTRYPETLSSGLSKVGGFFSIIKLLSLMALFHQGLFEN